jgi:pyrimidine deaminase RibD-like protein
LVNAMMLEAARLGDVARGRTAPNPNVGCDCMTARSSPGRHCAGRAAPCGRWR